MSLKAKIEAVIYAAEEPVTLAQLASLLGLEAQAELDELAAAQHRLPLDHDFGDQSPRQPQIPLPSEPELLNDEVLDFTALLEPEAASPDEPAATLREDNAADATVAAIEPEQVAAPGAPADSSELPTQAGLAPDPVPPESLQPSSAPKDERQLAREARDRDRAVRDYFRRLLDELIRDYSTGDRGLEIREVANGFRLATKPEYHDAVRGFAKSLKPPLKLTLQALETLAVVAYKQPITAPEVAEIRGVDSGGVLGSLMARKLVTPAGRKQVIGRPILYKTTKDFLLRFGLKDIAELPGIEEFEKMAGELRESDAVQEEMSMADTHNPSQEDIVDANLAEEDQAAEPQADGDSRAVDAVPVDGRLPGLAPDASGNLPNADPVDPSAEEAAIQNDEATASHEGQE